MGDRRCGTLLSPGSTAVKFLTCPKFNPETLTAKYHRGFKKSFSQEWQIVDGRPGTVNSESFV